MPETTYLHNLALAGSSTSLPPHGVKVEFDAAGHSLAPVDAATAQEACTVPGFSRVDAETVADAREALAATPLPDAPWPGANAIIGPPGSVENRPESLEGKTVTVKITGGADEDLVGSIVRGVVVADSLLSADAAHPAKATKAPDEELDGKLAQAERIGEEESAQINAAKGTGAPVSVPDPDDKGDGKKDTAEDTPENGQVKPNPEQSDAAKDEITENTDITPHTPPQPHAAPQNPTPPGPPVKTNPTPATTAPEAAAAKKARVKTEQAEAERKAKAAEAVKTPPVTHNGSLSALAAAEAALSSSHDGDLGGQG